MKIRKGAIVTVLGVVLAVSAMKAQTERGSSVFGVFSGSTPAGDSIRPLLGIPSDATAELMQWQLTLYQDAKTLAPARYALRCDYGPAVAGLPGLGKERIRLQREGSWKLGKGTKSKPEAVVYELDGAVSLFRLSADILHVLNRDRSLMNGTGGWSYTLYRSEASERPGDPSLTADAPRSYTIAPVASGQSVFGVFEGRSPCQGIARELKIGVDAGCIKVKWRVTLYQDPKTLAPTTYRLEDSLHRQAPREGNWTIIRGTEIDPEAPVYQLAPTETEAALCLLEGDNNVLFFLNQNRRPLVGHAEFSYTLNRRQPPSPTPASVCGSVWWFSPFISARSKPPAR